MLGPEYEIELKKDIQVKPLHLNVVKKIPFALKDGARAELQRLIDKGILRWLDENDVTKWLSRPRSWSSRRVA